MNTPYGKGIIKGANVTGVVFHTRSAVDIPKQHPGAKKNLMEEEYYHGLIKGHQQGYEAGRNEGHEIGFKEGVASLQHELEYSVDLLQRILEEFKQKQENLFDHAKPELIKFCLAVCEKVLRRELSDPGKFASQLQTLLDTAKSVVKDVPIQICIAPEDLSRLQKHINELPEMTEELKVLNFVADPDLEAGNCKIESSLGLINFDIQRLLKDIEQKTLEA